MSVTKKNHYLSQCIIKNFCSDSNRTFWVYDCKKGGDIYQRNITNLFYGRHLWGQGVKDSIHDNFEECIAKDLKEVLTWEIRAPIIPGPNGLTQPQFSCKVIENEGMRKNLNKLILQSMLVQARVAKGRNNDIVDHINDFFSNNTKGLDSMLTLVEVHPDAMFPPLILTDLLMFMFAVPIVYGRGAHLCFCVPISTTRMLIWGSMQDLSYFLNKYQNINYLNLCRIEQQSKECLIASQDKNYLTTIVPQIVTFNSGEHSFIIRAERGETFR